MKRRIGKKHRETKILKIKKDITLKKPKCNTEKDVKTTTEMLKVRKYYNE